MTAKVKSKILSELSTEGSWPVLGLPRHLTLVTGSPLCPLLRAVCALKMMPSGWRWLSVLVWMFVCHIRVDVVWVLIALDLMLLLVRILVVKAHDTPPSMTSSPGLLSPPGSRVLRNRGI